MLKFKSKEDAAAAKAPLERMAWAWQTPSSTVRFARGRPAEEQQQQRHRSWQELRPPPPRLTRSSMAVEALPPGLKGKARPQQEPKEEPRSAVLARPVQPSGAAGDRLSLPGTATRRSGLQQGKQLRLRRGLQQGRKLKQLPPPWLRSSLFHRNRKMCHERKVPRRA